MIAKLIFAGIVLGFAFWLGCPAIWAVCLTVALGAIVA